MLLGPFTLSALAIVGAVGWLGRTASPLVAIGAVALSVALAAMVLHRLAAMLPDRPRPLRHPGVYWLVPGIAAAALLIPLGAESVAHPPVRPSGSPVGTVRGFLGAVVDDDGVTACRYLTGAARAEAAQHECQGYFGDATLVLGGRTITSDAQLDRLTYVTHGNAVTVGGRSFALTRATAAGLEEFRAPPTPWRISSDVGWLTQTSGRATAAGRAPRAQSPCAARSTRGTRMRSAPCGAAA
jgi:hypothetical protein